MLKHRIVVLGAGYAGMMAAYRLAGKTDAQITLINASDVFVERIRLHQDAAGQQIKKRPIVDMLRGTGVDFVQGKVSRLNAERHTVEVQTVAGDHVVAYDTLVYALGSTIERDKVPGVRDHAFGITPDEVASLHEKLAAAPKGTKLVVCGGGLTGIESSAELAEAYPHIQVTLVTRETFAEQFSRKGQAYLQEMFKRMNITVMDNTTIQRIDPSSLITDGQPIVYDVCLWAGSFGVLPMAREAGITTNLYGQIVVNETMQSVSHSEIYAAGDSAALEEFPYRIRMSCNTALPMGAHAADSISAALKGKTAKPFGFSYYIWCVSLGRKGALVQLVNGNDTPQERIITGRMGAMIKEGICRGTVLVLHAERYLPGSYPMPQPTWQAKRMMRTEHGRI